MAWSENLAAMNTAVFPEVGESGSWSGHSDPVWIVLQEPEAVIEYGRSRAVTSKRMIEVQRAQVAQPAENDVVQLGTRQFTILAEPTLSDDGSIWLCEAREG